MTRKPKKTHRLTYGQGTFTWLPSKQLWRGRLEAGWDTDGKRRRIEVTARDEDTAWRKLMEARRELEAGTFQPDAARRTTVKDWATTWLDDRQTRVRPKTYATDASIVAKWIIPAVGRVRLEDLRADDVRKVASGVRAARRSATTARYAQGIFQQLCKDAKAEGYKVPDTVLLAKKSSKAVSDRDAIPLPDALKLLQHAAALADGSRWVAALLQGMRQGECLGLTWECVNLDAGTVDVSWQLQTLPYANRAEGTFQTPDGYESRQLWKSFHLVRPKTARGYRVIPLVPWMTAALTEWRKVCPDSEYGLVWPRPDGLPQASRVDGQAWKDLQDAANVKKGESGHYVLHEARHTTATLLLEAGVDPEVIKAILGHSDIVTSRGYMHVSQELTRRALESVAQTLQLGGVTQG